MDRDLATTVLFRVLLFLFGSCFLAAGSFIFLAVLNLIPNSLSHTSAGTVFGTLGSATFAFAGLGMVLYAVGLPNVAAKAGLMALLAFVLTFNWIAFGPGERQFQTTSSSSWGGKRVSTASETEGRILFGLAALVMDGLILFPLFTRKRYKS